MKRISVHYWSNFPMTNGRPGVFVVSAYPKVGMIITYWYNFP